MIDLAIFTTNLGLEAGISNFGYKVHRLGKKLINSDSFDELYINMISNFIEPNKLIKKDIYEPTSQLQDGSLS